MKKKYLTFLLITTLMAALVAGCTSNTENKKETPVATSTENNVAADTTDEPNPSTIDIPNDAIIIQEQGSFAVGGTVTEYPGTYNSDNFNGWAPYPEGQMYHGDHASVSYQIPMNAKELPLVFLHGAGQSSRSWETTPDGRDGFQNIFLRRGHGVYLVDQPRRGRAGRSTVEDVTIPTTHDEQMWFEIWRMGNWPDYNENVQFPQDDESLNQFFRQMTPNTGPFDVELISDTMAELFNTSGPGILVTHSQGGLPGWYTGIKNSDVKAIVSYEPGNYVFPENEVPDTMPSLTGDLTGVGIPMEDFMLLTEIPIVMYFGDYIPEGVTDELGAENWRVRMQLGREFVETINRHGGDATLVNLPEIGIYGNTHFLMAELNNVELADLLSDWLAERGLDN